MMPDAPSVIAYVALGSNLGDREQNLRDALARLDLTPEIQVTRISGFLENPAVGGPPDSPAFVNAVAEVKTTLEPIELLNRLLTVERDLGRQRREKWGPRTIDLDLVLYGDQIIHTPGLTVPHHLMHQRRFVLAPLAELSPELEHPVLKRSINQLLHDAT